MKNPAQPVTLLVGIRVAGGTVLLRAAAGLMGLGLVGPRRTLRP